MAAQKNSLGSLFKILDNSLILDYLLAEHGRVCAMANSTCCTWIDTSGELEVQRHEIMKQVISWLKKMTPSKSLSLTIFVLIELGLWDHDSKLYSRLENYPAYQNHSSLLMSCILSKGLNACLHW